MKKAYIFLALFCIIAVFVFTFFGCNKAADIELSEVIHNFEKLTSYQSAFQLEFLINDSKDTGNGLIIMEKNTEHINFYYNMQDTKYFDYNNDYFIIREENVLDYRLNSKSNTLGSILHQLLLSLDDKDYSYEKKSGGKGITNFIISANPQDAKNLIPEIYRDSLTSCTFTLSIDNDTKVLNYFEIGLSSKDTSKFFIKCNISNLNQAKIVLPEKIVQIYSLKDDVTNLINPILSLTAYECQIKATINNNIEHNITTKYDAAKGEYMCKGSYQDNNYSSYIKDSKGYLLKENLVIDVFDDADTVKLINYTNDASLLKNVYLNTQDTNKLSYNLHLESNDNSNIICFNLDGSKYELSNYALYVIVDSQTKKIEQLRISSNSILLEITLKNLNQSPNIEFPQEIGALDENYNKLTGIINALASQNCVETLITINGNQGLAYGKFSKKDNKKYAIAALNDNSLNGYYIDDYYSYKYVDTYLVESNRGKYFMDSYLDLDFLRLFYNTTSDIQVYSNYITVYGLSVPLDSHEVIKRLNIKSQDVYIGGATIYFDESNKLPKSASFFLFTSDSKSTLNIDYKYNENLTFSFPDYILNGFYKTKDSNGLEGFQYKNNSKIYVDSKSNTVAEFISGININIIFYDTITLTKKYTFNAFSTMRNISFYDGILAIDTTEKIYIIDFSNPSNYKTLNYPFSFNDEVVVYSKDILITRKFNTIYKVNISSQSSEVMLDNQKNASFAINRSSQLLYSYNNDNTLECFNINNNSLVFSIDCQASSFYFDGISLHIDGKLYDSLTGTYKMDGDLSANIPPLEEFIPEYTLYQDEFCTLLRGSNGVLGLYSFEEESYIFTDWAHSIQYIADGLIILSKSYGYNSVIAIETRNLPI